MDHEKQAEHRKETSEFLSSVWIHEEDVLAQVRYERQRSIDFVDGKRQEFRNDMLLYNNVKDSPDKIGDTTLFNIHQTLMARSYTDKIQAKFNSKTVGGMDAVQNLNSVFEEDYQSDDYDRMKFQKEWDKFFYGVGIVARVGWDATDKANKWQVVDPMTTIFDQNGDYLNNDYQYVGFDLYTALNSLKCYENWEMVTDSDSEEGAKINKTLEQQDMGYPVDSGTEYYNPYYETYRHFSHFNGKKAMVYTANNGMTLLHAKFISPCTPEEEKDHTKIHFPFAFFYWKPRRFDPFGYRVADLVRDVQINKARNANLRMKKARAELYPMYLYNKNLINRKDLQFGENKAIPIDPGVSGAVPLDNAMTPIRRDLRIDTSLTIDQTLDRQAEKSTGIGDVAMGTTPETRETATTNTLVQTNLDINLSLNSKINNFGEKQFLRLWLGGYWKNFKAGDRKFVSLRTGVGNIPISMKRSDFLVDWNFDIDISTAGEIAQRLQNERVAYAQSLSFILSNPGAPQISKDFALRKKLKADGLSEAEIAVLVPSSPQEMKQQIENQLLLRGIFVPVDPEDDDLTHLVQLTGAGESKEVQMHRMTHMQQYISKGSPQPNVANPGLTNNMMAQTVAQIGNQATSQNAEAQVTSL